MISAKIVADSMSPYGDRLTTMLVTFPRYILAELNTHRTFSKNSASSRAIPFKKMCESVKSNPFIPVVWQKDHKGMQGSEYFTDSDNINGCIDLWLKARDSAVEYAEALNEDLGEGGVTKQLCNRLLEPFMWHTVLITANEWDNFFELRCPQYYAELEDKYYKSKKDFINEFWNPTFLDDTVPTPMKVDDWDALRWLEINSGQADIHMMLLAEAMWDARNSSTITYLQPGDWHIPFEDKINLTKLQDALSELNDNSNKFQACCKVSTAMCARTSYSVFGDEKEFSYKKQIELHDKMLNQKPFHASPFEHCARVMTKKEHSNFLRCRNFSGFIQYRHSIEAKK